MSWSKKYKKSIDCNNPKGFSQKAHCAGKKKNESMEFEEISEEILDEKLIVYNNRKKYGQVVFIAGGAGSGKGFAISNFLDSATYKIRDVDEMKKQLQILNRLGKLSIDSIIKKYSKNIKPKDLDLINKIQDEGFKLQNLNLKNPNHVYALHILVKAIGIKDSSLEKMLLGKENPNVLPNILFDITAKDITDITNVIPMLKKVGYKSNNIHLTWILTNYTVSLENNKSRSRKVPDGSMGEENIMLKTHEGASNTIWGLLTKGLPKGMNGRADVILNNPELTVFMKGADGKEIEKTQKGVSVSTDVTKDGKRKSTRSEKDTKVKFPIGFEYLKIKKEGGGIISEKEWKKKLFGWIKNNAPESITANMKESTTESVTENRFANKPEVTPKQLSQIQADIKKINRKIKVYISKHPVTKGELNIELGHGHDNDAEIDKIYTVLKKRTGDWRTGSMFNESINEQADYKYLTQVILDAKPKYDVHYNSSHNVVNIGGVGYDKGDLVKNFNQKPGSSTKIKNNFYHAHQDPQKTKREVEKLSKGKIKVKIEKNPSFVSYSLSESLNERESKHFTYDEVVKSIVDFAKSKGYKIPPKGLEIIKGNPPEGPVRGWSRGTSIPLDKKINLTFQLYGVGKVFTVHQKLTLNKKFALESVNEAKKLPKFKNIPSWARFLAQQSDGEWTWYEEAPTMIRFKNGGGAWKQDGNQIYTGVKTNGKDWDKRPTYYDVKNGKIKESVTEINETMNEGKKRFYQQDRVGSAKYTISYHDGKSKHKDGSDFYGIQILKNKKELEKFRSELLKKGYREDSGFKKESVNENYKGSFSDFKYEFGMALDNIGISPKAIKKISKKGKGYEVRLSSYMSDESTWKKIGEKIGADLLDFKKGTINIGLYESFTATSKKSGETAVFKSKDNRDAAIKAGTHSKIDDKEDDSKSKGKSVFSKDSGYDAPDLKKTPSKEEPKKDEPKNVNPEKGKSLEFVANKVEEIVPKSEESQKISADYKKQKAERASMKKEMDAQMYNYVKSKGQKSGSIDWQTIDGGWNGWTNSEEFKKSKELGDKLDVSSDDFYELERKSEVADFKDLVKGSPEELKARHKELDTEVERLNAEQEKAKEAGDKDAANDAYMAASMIGNKRYAVYSKMNGKSDNEIYSYMKKEDSDNERIYKDKLKKRNESVNEGYSDFIKAKNLTDIVALSKKKKNAIFYVTDDNNSRIGTFYLKNGKFAKATTANANYDLQNSKTKLKDRNDVIYKYKVDESVVNELNEDLSMKIGKVVSITKYNPKTNRKESVDVKITNYIKKPGSKDFVEYELKGKKRKISIDVFKSIMESIEEAKLSTIHKAAKKGSYPVSLVVIKDGKVIKQVLNIKTPQAVPAVFNVVKNYHKHKDATVHIEDSTGKRLFSEATFRPNSGTMSGGTYGLDKRKYELKRDVKGVQIGDYTNVTLPKGTIIYNLPGGVFAHHRSLKSYEGGQNKYFNKSTFRGISIRREKNVILSIEKNSKILESVNEASIKGRNNKTGESFGMVIGSDKKNKEGEFEVTIRISYSSRISSYKFMFDKGSNLIAIKDYGYSMDGKFPDMKGGGSVKSIRPNPRETITQIAKITSPAFAKKIVQHVKKVNESVNEGKTISSSKISMMGARVLNKISIGTIFDTEDGKYEITDYGRQANAFKEFEAEHNGKKVKVKLTAMYGVELEVTDDVRSSRFNKKVKLNSIILESINEVGVNVWYFYKKANKNKNKFFKMLSDFRKKHSDTAWIKMLNYALEDFNENPKKYKTIDDKQNILFKNLQNNKKVYEGMMSTIDQIRQDSKDVRDFVKNVFKDREFKKMSNDKDFIKYLKSIYEGVDESAKVKSLEEKINLFVEKNVPTNPSKWSYYKSQAKKKFDVYPSAYANGWAAKKYKAAGGGWKKEK